jgi:hypothetical protein
MVCVPGCGLRRRGGGSGQEGRGTTPRREVKSASGRWAMAPAGAARTAVGARRTTTRECLYRARQARCGTGRCCSNTFAASAGRTGQQARGAAATAPQRCIAEGGVPLPRGSCRAHQALPGRWRCCCRCWSCGTQKPMLVERAAFGRGSTRLMRFPALQGGIARAGWKHGNASSLKQTERNKSAASLFAPWAVQKSTPHLDRKHRGLQPRHPARGSGTGRGSRAPPMAQPRAPPLPPSRRHRPRHWRSSGASPAPPCDPASSAGGTWFSSADPSQQQGASDVKVLPAAQEGLTVAAAGHHLVHSETARSAASCCLHWQEGAGGGQEGPGGAQGSVITLGS